MGRTFQEQSLIVSIFPTVVLRVPLSNCSYEWVEMKPPDLEMPVTHICSTELKQTSYRENESQGISVSHGLSSVCVTLIRTFQVKHCCTHVIDTHLVPLNTLPKQYTAHESQRTFVMMRACAVRSTLCGTILVISVRQCVRIHPDTYDAASPRNARPTVHVGRAPRVYNSARSELRKVRRLCTCVSAAFPPCFVVSANDWRSWVASASRASLPRVDGGCKKNGTYASIRLAWW